MGAKCPICGNGLKQMPNLYGFYCDVCHRPFLLQPMRQTEAQALESIIGRDIDEMPTLRKPS